CAFSSSRSPDDRDDAFAFDFQVQVLQDRLLLAVTLDQLGYLQHRTEGSGKSGTPAYERGAPGVLFLILWRDPAGCSAHHWLFGSAGSLPNPPYRKLG